MPFLLAIFAFVHFKTNIMSSRLMDKDKIMAALLWKELCPQLQEFRFCHLALSRCKKVKAGPQEHMHCDCSDSSPQGDSQKEISGEAIIFRQGNIDPMNESRDRTQQEAQPAYYFKPLIVRLVSMAIWTDPTKIRNARSAIRAPHDSPASTFG